MDVARPLVDCLEDDFVDELDDARLLRHLQQVLAIVLRTGEGEVVVAGHLLDRVAADAVVILDDLVDLVPGREYRADLEAGQQLDLVKNIEVERVTRRHLEHAVLAGDGREVIAIDEARRQ